MYKIINGKGFIISQLPFYNNRVCTAGESIHDGDTIYTSSEGVLPIRFLGIDTPEMSYSISIPKDTESNNVNNFNPPIPVEDFTEYLQDPFNKKYLDSDAFINALGQEIIEKHLRPLLTDKTAENHKRHALRSRQELIYMVEEDIGLSITSNSNFQFFIALSYETVDRYGRILGWIHKFRAQTNQKNQEKNLNLSYNEMMLKKGMGIPYFIWPNISPFRRSLSISQAIPKREDFQNCIELDDKLRNARNFTRNARQIGIGLFNENDKLMLMPFELRYLADRYIGIKTEVISCISNIESKINSRATKKPIHRYVIDLSKSHDPILKKPENYYKINIEDRLFIDEHYVPLFEKNKYEVES